MRTLDQIRFEVSIKLIDDRLKVFEKFLDEAEEDNFNYPAIYQAIVANNKITEGESEVPENEELETEELDEEFPHKNRRLGKKHNKSAWLRKERQVRLHRLVDWKPGIKWWQSVDDGGRRIGEKGDKLYTRKGRVAREKFTEEPTLNMDEDDSLTIDNTGLYLDKNQDIWTDEEISQSIEYFRYEHDHNDDDWDDDDFEYDPYQSALNDREAAWDEISDLKRQINTFKDFIGEFNLNTLYERWIAIR